LIIDDIQILKQIKNKIEYTGTIKTYPQISKYFSIDGYEKEYDCKPYCRLCFMSHHMVNELISKGCTEHKSFTFKFPKNTIPENLYSHFIRGLFDGNGTIGYWIDNKNSQHKKFNFGYCGTTEIVNTLSSIFSQKFNCSPAIISRFPDRNNNNMQLEICGNRLIQKILDWLYKDATMYILRKYNKYIELIKQNKKIDNRTLDDYKGNHPPKKVIDINNNIVYLSVTDAAKKLGLTTGAISYRCSHNTNNFMYYDEWINKNAV